MNQDIKHILEFITNLSSEMQRQFAALNEKFDRQDLRMSRQGALLSTGARQLTRIIEWSEKLEDMLKERDVKITELEERVRRLEGFKTRAN
jgi:hypothetical protein